MSWGNNHSWDEVEDFDSDDYDRFYDEAEQYEWEINQTKQKENDYKDNLFAGGGSDGAEYR